MKEISLSLRGKGRGNRGGPYCYSLGQLANYVDRLQARSQKDLTIKIRAARENLLALHRADG